MLDSTEHVADDGDHNPSNVEGNISFKQVWFAYNEENYVLKDISFELTRGKTIAFVGATGAGKSSIINLINRFYEINKGEILLDGVNINQYGLSTLRKNVGMVLQDVFLFSGTIAENIHLGDTSITEEQIWEAAKLVGADKFIQKPQSMN